ncbi:dihydroxyacetone kinase family protein [Demequina sp.]|uniref:dihydroxyacetone kinase family protein n=1 Tax=Demequina sp. TaxID=2050685 RepID=UPI0025BE5577|nr:dihydroxyacetone kinase family protein [Demequina sp.]
MSYLQNDAADFAAESAAGFVAAHRGLVRRVEGGVVRVGATPAGQVAVVIGGGSGHYPAFAGLVGPGLAHGAAMGNIFASPSAQQVYSVARSVATDAGVLLTYGNYAGDVLNFDQAQERLRADGIPCETVTVTDDVASASRDESEKRRGIAGDLSVFRAAGWAAESGWDLARVTELAARANARTRSLGVAFGGCTLPGATEPLFRVPEGKMAVGMGIHGEPGIDMVDMPNANGLADLLVRTVLEERPDGIGDGGRVAVVVNGLGSVKGEELYVFYGAVAGLLTEQGFTIVQPEVGEFATSFEMAGVSLTVTWLDDDLEAAWRSPTYTAAYRKGSVDIDENAEAAVDAAEVEVESFAEASSESAAAAPTVFQALAAMRDVIDESCDELGRLDAIAGDGDHGIGMQRGVHAAVDRAREAVEAGAGAGSVATSAGDAWANRAGGTSGSLWGGALRAFGEGLGDSEAPTRESAVAAAQAGIDHVQRSGGAAVGDKTMVDALVPFGDALKQAIADGATLTDAWAHAADEATRAAQATSSLLPRKGRARPHMEKSLGTPDPGAVSFAMAMTAVAGALKDAKDKGGRS